MNPLLDRPTSALQAQDNVTSAPLPRVHAVHPRLIAHGFNNAPKNLQEPPTIVDLIADR